MARGTANTRPGACYQHIFVPGICVLGDGLDGGRSGWGWSAGKGLSART